MAFWKDESTREPLRQNRWYMYFGVSDQTKFSPPAASLQANIYALKECTKPSYKVETTSHVLINHTFNYPKNVVWNPIKVKMVSTRGAPQDVPLTMALQTVLKASNYHIPHYNTANSGIGKKSMLGALGNNVNIVQVDANGVPVEIWCICNPIITDVNYGSLSYESDGFVDIDFTITYDYANIAVADGTSEDKTSVYPLESQPDEWISFPTPEFEQPPALGDFNLPDDSDIDLA